MEKDSELVAARSRVGSSWSTQSADRASDGSCSETWSPEWTAAPLPPARRREGCGLGGVFDGLLGMLFGSDRVEYSLQSLEEVAELGRGSFGRVSLVWCHRTCQCLALKAMPKSLIVERKLQHATISEKAIMKQIDSTFVTRLVATFNSRQHLYILMEAARGGDLHCIYGENVGFFGSGTHARFYSACMLNAFSYLHERCIMYRDLKMENVVLDGRGYAKLCDFGLARTLWRSIGSAYTICGTPEYKAPEIDSSTGYDHAVDWWALGVLVYELMMGTTPFVGESVERIRQNVRAGIGAVLPASDQYPWASLVRGLCQQDPSQRLPMFRGGVNNVRDHAWYLDPYFDWAELGRCEMAAPHVPCLSHLAVAGHVHFQDHLKPEDATYEDAESGWEVDFEDPMGPPCVVQC
eukprot:CAMPEP_0179053160 /NCGR_PEP_ID=MMETSP0796-20121207/22127_1 /TAXON_ID=73915 /ORGANISM="Pyrodinium bahamense, Strain pbaha01" /LENGTH=407 /DNA_ID=CAMNT_0020749743 /DNA_START=42 /DNA_END=1265 /DNA_ORIENTATION=-